MAAKKKGTSRSRAAASERSVGAGSSRQLKSVIWFTVAAFLLCVVFIKGENVWTVMHNFLFGVFGVTAYVYPFLLGAVAVLYALDRLSGAIDVKVIEAGILAVLVGTAIDVFGPHAAGENFSQHIGAAYTAGAELKSGGALGALIGWPLYYAFGKIPACITIVLLIFVFLMIVTGTSLSALFRTVSRPVKRITEEAETAYQARAEREQQEAETGERPGKKLKVIKGFNVDLPVDDIPEKRPKRSKSASLEEKQKKVVSTYYDEEPEPEPEPQPPVPEPVKPEPEPVRVTEPEGADDRRTMDRALKTAQDEAAGGEEIDLDEVREEIAESISSGIVLSEEEGYRFPPVSLLNPPQFENNQTAAQELDNTAEHLVETLRSFGVETRIVDICRGPTVTRYELQPCAGVKISRITGLSNDIALNLATAGVRIEAPIPGKAAVGIEVPNKTSAVVGVREIIESPAFASSKSKLTIALGRDIAGNVMVGDVAKMPHGLIAGATGSGKSVCINSIIISILYKATPEEVKLLLIDPKVVELGVYNGIPHLLVPVVTEPRKAAGALGWAVSEMEKRYQMFADRDVRNLAGYNHFVEEHLDEEPELKKLPHIVIVIDELADLMMTAPKEVEDSINRIAAKARAAGMHLLIATQRPSVDVVTGVIKANIPTRIAFAVSSQIDSRTILDEGGAEKLLGRGDMLYSPFDTNKPSRVQGCFVSDSEVEAVVDYIKHGDKAEYDDDIMVEIERQAAVEKQKKTGLPEDAPDDDPMLEEAVKVVVEAGQASTSLLQRKLKLGYARAARIVDQLEERGVVGPYEGAKPRKVLITADQLMEREAAGE